ncbi:MAG: hypothetical protein UX10_C0004G0020 [Candidatus Magasanikbacteria bacterium GW2011_GWA2_45_39]|uniref:Transcriptional regulator n=2 Tax=Candidatus Magasanikiibacteriota TaxID=1752731 RepID=A0A0G1N032_9BACT|nr:MAG: hypothetical protein UX10_C0004G0020 [Candidatus Magasanikbacteria bacterium GW2011_GWA2_45_39]KKU13986.1 MAG: hypothetical protein UX20_C0008G0008 [Candidatus Magasanikbacteria bacterium GW2011_GWC2_45_8]HBW74184.1 hypothetical protein [Candidatus Magasanikbacteria bacterium]
MLEHLFGSKTRLKLLRIFFDHPNDHFFVRELARKLNTQINAVRRELDHLSAAHIIAESKLPVAVPENSTRRARGRTRGTTPVERRRFYHLSDSGLLNPELQSLLLKAQLFGEERLVNDLKKAGTVDYLVMTGVFVSAPEAVTDILLVGSAPRKAIDKIITHFEKEYGREVRYTLMATKEFLYRRDIADKFLNDLMEHKYVVVCDTLNRKK